MSFSQTPAGQDDSDCTLGDALPGPGIDDPAICVISTEELQSLVFCLGSGLSSLESDALRCYMEGLSYEEMAVELGLRHEDDRQCSSAREAEGAHAPAGPPGPFLGLSSLPGKSGPYKGRVQFTAKRCV